MQPWLDIGLLGAAEAGEQAASSAPAAPEAEDFVSAAHTLKDTLLDMWADFVAHLPLIVIAALVVLATWGTVRGFNRIADRLHERFDVRHGLRSVLERLARILIWVAGLVIAAMVVFPGLSPSSALAGLGVGSVAIGFAFKDIFENWFAGMLILAREPFKLGDFIECEDHEGTVDSITVRNTFILRSDGQRVVMPNAILFKNPVIVRTNKPVRRETIIVGVAYGEDVVHAREVIREAVKSCDSLDTDHDLEVRAHEFSSSSIEFKVMWWSGSRPSELRASRDEVVEAIKRALDDAGVEIPFPQRSLWFRDPLELSDERADAPEKERAGGGEQREAAGRRP